MRRTPSRQGTHLPQDSLTRKFVKYLATSTMQLRSSMTIMPPEPIIEPILVSSSKSTPHVEILLGNAAARRSARLDRLELLAVGNPAADVEDDLPERRSHRNLDEAGVVDLADQGEDLRPLAALGPDGGVPVGAPVDDERDVRPGLDVVEVRGLVVEALVGRVDVLRAGLAGPPLQGGEEGRGLAADEGAAAPVDLHIEGEARPEDVLPEEPRFPGLLDGHGDVLHREGVFVPDVDVALAGADGVGADDHPLEDEVGVPLQ